MKIALITFHHVINYGSALQSFATQQVLKDLGCEVDIIDYVNNVNRDDLLLKNRANEFRYGHIPLIRQLYEVFQWYDIYRMSKVFFKFRLKRLNLTQRFYSCDEIKRGLNNSYDAYCTGSDQVWNTHVSPNSIGVDRAFYLDFAPNDSYLFSYAASFGMREIPDKDYNLIYNLLQRYKHISVREKIGLKILHELGFKNAVQVLDPTFLLTQKEWQGLAEYVKSPKHYILTYQLHKNSNMKKYIKNMAKKLNLPVVNISFSWRGYFQSKYAAYGISPEQFLFLFCNADYVITDSFHATAFSIIFEKPFVSIYSDEFNNRMESILKLTGLEKRHLKDYKDLNLLEEECRFEKSREIIMTERINSLKWLEAVLKEIADDVGIL